MIYAISSTVYFFACIVISAYVDSRIWKKRGITNHIGRFIGRAALSIVPVYIIYPDFSVFDWVTFLLFIGAVWWMAFDAFLYAFMKIDQTHVGSVSWFDRIFLIVAYITINKKFPESYDAHYIRSVTDNELKKVAYGFQSAAKMGALLFTSTILYIYNIVI